MVMTPHEATHVKDADGIEQYVPLGDIFKEDYVPNRWMSYKQFQQQFRFREGHSEHSQVLEGTRGAEVWLERKMQISEEEAHSCHQTGRG
jgi:adenosine deaminase CECR1